MLRRVNLSYGITPRTRIRQYQVIQYRWSLCLRQFRATLPHAAQENDRQAQRAEDKPEADPVVPTVVEDEAAPPPAEDIKTLRSYGMCPPRMPDGRATSLLPGWQNFS